MGVDEGGIRGEESDGVVEVWLLADPGFPGPGTYIAELCVISLVRSPFCKHRVLTFAY